MVRFLSYVIGALMLLAVGIAVRAAEVEVRNFTMKVDGKPSGESHMTITQQDDGSLSMSCRAEIKVTKLGLVVYKYSYRGTETWKDGALVRFESQTDDNGKKFTVKADAGKEGVHLRVNKEEHVVRVDWLTSYWQLPDAEKRKHAIALLDADTGSTMTGAMKYLGTQQISVAGMTVNCFHYRITGPNMVEAWYDAQERLVRQEWMEDGHPAVMELSSIRR
jgi:hypothetical protein